MLRALELYLSPFVAAELPADVELVRGPFLVENPWAADRRVVGIHALRLDPHELPPPQTADRPAFTFQAATWPIAPGIASFTLPPALVGELFEVEAPVGYLVKPGDDYYLDGTTIRFFHAPTGPGQVLARVRASAAAGHARRGAATLTLDVSAYGRDPATADPLFETVTQVVLTRLAGAPYLALSSVAGLDTLVRFVDFRAHVRYIERKLSGYENVVVCTTRVELVGELDVVVATGAAAPVDRIAEIEGELTVAGDGDEESAPLEIHIEDTGGA